MASTGFAMRTAHSRLHTSLNKGLVPMLPEDFTAEDMEVSDAGERDGLEKTALVFTTPSSFGIQFYATFFLYEGQKKGLYW